MEEAEADARQPARTEMPPSGSGAHAPTGAQHQPQQQQPRQHRGCNTLRPPVVTHLHFDNLKPPTIPIKARGDTEPDNRNNVEHQIWFATLIQQGSETGDHNNEALSSGILRGGLESAATSSRGSRGRDSIPLTPETLLLLDRLEPDKGKQARLLTEHLIDQRTLPCTEQELHTQLERKADREIKRQHAAAEAAANRAAIEQMDAHETAMAAHLA